MKIQRRKIIIAGIMMVLILATAYFLKMQEEKISGKQALKIMSDKVDLQVKNVHYTDVTEKGSKWEVTADMVRYMKSENTAHFDKVTIKLIMINGKQFVLHADRGEMKTDTKDMMVSGNVVIVSNNGDRFTTDNLKYSDSLGQFKTDAPVEMENRRIKIKGVGMSLSLKEENAAILSGVSAVIR